MFTHLETDMEVRYTTPSTRTGASCLQPFWTDLQAALQNEIVDTGCLDAPDIPAGSTAATKHGPSVVLVYPTLTPRP